MQDLLLHSKTGSRIKASPEDALELEEDHVCIICMDAPCSVTFVPCEHDIVCMSCSKLVMDSSAQCPMCREHIEQAIPSLRIDSD